MGMFLQAAAAVLIAVVLGLSLNKQGKEIGVLLTVAVCCMVVVIALNYLEPVVDFLRQLEALCQAGDGWLSVLLKAVGIGLIAEVSALVCGDAGNGSLGKALQLLGSAVILWMSIPIFTALMDLIQKILGEI